MVARIWKRDGSVNFLQAGRAAENLASAGVGMGGSDEKAIVRWLEHGKVFETPCALYFRHDKLSSIRELWRKGSVSVHNAEFVRRAANGEEVRS